MCRIQCSEASVAHQTTKESARGGRLLEQKGSTLHTTSKDDRPDRGVMKPGNGPDLPQKLLDLWPARTQERRPPLLPRGAGRPTGEPTPPDVPSIWESPRPNKRASTSWTDDSSTTPWLRSNGTKPLHVHNSSEKAPAPVVNHGPAVRNGSDRRRAHAPELARGDLVEAHQLRRHLAATSPSCSAAWQACAHLR